MYTLHTIVSLFVVQEIPSQRQLRTYAPLEFDYVINSYEEHQL